MEAGRMKGEVAVVTGSDSGIGQATAIAFAKEGADVAVTYRHDHDGAERTRAAIEKAGRKAIVVQVDQRDPSQVADLFRQVRERLGTPTILINNAGVGGGGTLVKDTSPEQWDDVIRTDLSGPFYCAKAFLDGLDRSDRRAVIINITSVHEEIPMPGAAAYCAAKGGLRNLTRTLALELAGRNINVVNVAPGMVLTALNQAAVDDPALREQRAQRIPLKRAAVPEEIARVVVFLASADAAYVHGTSVVVDGGLMQNLGQGA